MKVAVSLLIWFLAFSSLAQNNYRVRLDSISMIQDYDSSVVILRKMEQESLPKKIKLEVLEALCKRSLTKNDAKTFVKYCSKGIELAKSIKNDSSLSFFIKSNGAYQSYQGKQKEAIESFKQSAEIAKRGGHKLLEAQNYSNIGGLLIDEKEYEKAEYYLKLSLEISEKKPNELPFKRTRLLSTRLLATLYDRLGKQEAGELYESLIVETESLQDTFLICSNLMFYARYQEGQGKVREALASMDRAHELILSSNHVPTILAILGMKATILEKLGDYKEAHRCLSEYVKLSNSYYNEENQRQLNEFDKKLELNEERIGRAEAEVKSKIAEAKTARMRFILVLSGSIVALLSLIIFMWIRKRNRRNAEVIKNQRFSSLLEGEEKERIRIARELHDGIVQELGMIQRQLYTIDADQVKLDEIQSNFSQKINNLRAITHQMMPLNLKDSNQVSTLQKLFSDSLSNSSITHNIELFGTMAFTEQTFLQIYRICQELVNNTIKHSQAKNISVLIDIRASLIRFVYEDDGIGFTEVGTHGIGMSNIKARVEALNGKSTWYSSEKEGSQFVLTIPT